jgi:DNA-binding MarR family transcriptional regulator
MAAAPRVRAFPARRGSIVPSIDRNERARLLFQAEALDRRTHRPGQHGGCLKHTGLRVLRALLFHFANAVTGRCDPGYDALARAAGVARSTVAVALARLEAAGLIVRTRRQAGMTRWTNAYAFNISESGKSSSRPQTTTRPLEQPKSAKTGPTGDRVRALLDALQRRERRLGLAP